ncbi:MAG: hypothetical protein KDD38_09405 [Bdellovibrionales bacterium]|nr:hypothetical protein [Bdellovibrionales bacterium]
MDRELTIKTIDGCIISKEVPGYVRRWAKKEVKSKILNTEELERLKKLLTSEKSAPFWVWLKDNPLKEQMQKHRRVNTVQFLLLCIKSAWPIREASGVSKSFSNVRSGLISNTNTLEIYLNLLLKLDSAIYSEWRASLGKVVGKSTIKKTSGLIEGFQSYDFQDINNIHFLKERALAEVFQNHLKSLQTYLNQVSKYRSLKKIVDRTVIVFRPEVYSPKLEVGYRLPRARALHEICLKRKYIFSPQTIGHTLGLNNFLAAIFYLSQLTKIRMECDGKFALNNFYDVYEAGNEDATHRCYELISAFDHYFCETHPPSIFFILDLEYPDALKRNRISDKISSFWQKTPQYSLPNRKPSKVILR